MANPINIHTHNCEPSRIIPFPKSHIPRTRSELQLAEETIAAEFRDKCMFDRLLYGIHLKSIEYSRKLSSTSDREFLARQTRAMIEKLIQQRNNELILSLPTKEECSLYSRESSRLTNDFVSAVTKEPAIEEDDGSFSDDEVFDFDL